GHAALAGGGELFLRSRTQLVWGTGGGRSSGRPPATPSTRSASQPGVAVRSVNVVSSRVTAGARRDRSSVHTGPRLETTVTLPRPVTHAASNDSVSVDVSAGASSACPGLRAPTRKRGISGRLVTNTLPVRTVSTQVR